MLLLFPSMRYKPNPITWEGGNRGYVHVDPKGHQQPNRSRRAYFEQHVFLVGSEVHLVLVVLNTKVDDVGQQLIVSVNHLQLLLQRLHTTDSC